MQNANNFKKLIFEKGLNYAVVANLVGVSEQSIHRYANGFRKPSWDVARRIAKIFNLSDEEFSKLFDEV